jgi:hypothetical protein
LAWSPHRSFAAARSCAVCRGIRRLSSIYFENEEVVFCPSLRLAFPDLLTEMERQHGEVREVEQHVGDLLSDPPPAPESRWLDDLRLFGAECSTGQASIFL